MKRNLLLICIPSFDSGMKGFRALHWRWEIALFRWRRLLRFSAASQVNGSCIRGNNRVVYMDNTGSCLTTSIG